MRLRRLLGFTMLVVAGALTAPASAQGFRKGDCGEFTVAMIPDTQNYIDYRHQSWSGFKFDAVEQFYGQMRWIAENARSAGGDIVFATHVGDVWQHYSAWMDPAHSKRGFAWMPNGGSQVARSPKVHTRAFEIPAGELGFQLLAGRLPFSVVPGNHDYDALWTDPSQPPRPEEDAAGVRHVGGLTGFQSIFSDRSPLFRDQPWYVASHDGGADSAQVFTAGQCRFLHIGLQYHAPDASLSWAREVIARYPGLPTIVTTHDYLHRDGKRNRRSNPNNAVLDPTDNDPEMIWDEFISGHDQIFLVLSGHVGGQAYSVDTNRSGTAVHQMMADYQGRGQSAIEAGGEGDVGDGWLRLLKFRLDADKPAIEVRTYSTHYRKFASELAEYGAWYKAHDGQMALSDQQYLAREEFTIDLADFRSRFEAAGAAR
jgi:hypothetical protein